MHASLLWIPITKLRSYGHFVFTGDDRKEKGDEHQSMKREKYQFNRVTDCSSGTISFICICVHELGKSHQRYEMPSVCILVRSIDYVRTWHERDKYFKQSVRCFQRGQKSLSFQGVIKIDGCVCIVCSFKS